MKDSLVVEIGVACEGAMDEKVGVLREVASMWPGYPESRHPL